MAPGRISSIISWVLAIGAGIAVSRGWYGTATTLGLAALILIIEGFGEALGATLEQYLGKSRDD